jgi:hypothetical protein
MASAIWSMSVRGPSSIVCVSHTVSPHKRSFSGHWLRSARIDRHQDEPLAVALEGQRFGAERQRRARGGGRACGKTGHPEARGGR